MKATLEPDGHDMADTRNMVKCNLTKPRGSWLLQVTTLAVKVAKITVLRSATLEVVSESKVDEYSFRIDLLGVWIDNREIHVVEILLALARPSFEAISPLCLLRERQPWQIVFRLLGSSLNYEDARNVAEVHLAAAILAQSCFWHIRK